MSMTERQLIERARMLLAYSLGEGPAPEGVATEESRLGARIAAQYNADMDRHRRPDEREEPAREDGCISMAELYPGSYMLDGPAAAFARADPPAREALAPAPPPPAAWLSQPRPASSPAAAAVESRVLEYIDRTPWAINREGLALIRAIAARVQVNASDIQAIGKEAGAPINGTAGVQLRGGVAIMPVTGPLFRYANFFTRISGATSFETLANDFGQALADPKVRAIVLDVNSPGGEVSGTEETAKLIRAARAVKPVYALVSGVAASAAYWLASAASKVVTIETGIIGSIGTVLSVDPRSSRDDLVFVSSQSPRKRMDPTTDAGAADVQALVDSLAQVFVENVAANRSVSPEKVLSDFGQGGVLVGAAAVRAGLADQVGTLESLVYQLSQ